MLRVIKRVILSCIAVLGISTFALAVLIINPGLSYANKTEFNEVTVYHNSVLQEGTAAILEDVISILSKSEIYKENIQFQLCMNDDRLYPNLQPWLGWPLAYATLNKTTIKNCDLHFQKNVASSQWEYNNYELREFNLTYLLAHEMTHNLQFDKDLMFVVKKTLGKAPFWKLEGHADYVAREFKNDGRLLEKINKLLIEERKEYVGVPVFELEDGTKQSILYFKYSLVVQYFLDIKGLSYTELCDMELDFDSSYSEMLNWSKK